MNLNCDFHTHTNYSHGKGTIADNANAAKEKGLKTIAITDHGFSHFVFGMKRRKLDAMKDECVAAEKESGVKVLLGIESNLVGGKGEIDVKREDYDKLDIILAGVHKSVYVKTLKDYNRLIMQNIVCSGLKLKPSDKLIDFNTETYIKAIKNNPIDILTHLGYCCPCRAEEVAKAARDYGTYIEINTKKVHLTDEEWAKVIDTGVNFVIDSDAHSPDRVGDTALADELFKRVNFPLERIMNIDGRTPEFRFAEFKKKL